MEDLTQKVQKIAGSLVLAGSLAALAGCDENKEALLLETKIDNCGQIKLTQVILEGNSDYYRLDVYDCGKNLKTTATFGNGIGVRDEVTIVHEGNTYDFKYF